MDRKSPYEHDVHGHYRGGAWVEIYKRGTGDKPEDRIKRKTRIRSHSKAGWSITFKFPSGATESYNGKGTSGNALRSALNLIQRPEIPSRARMRRIN